MVAFCFLPIPGPGSSGTSAQSELVATAISMAWVPQAALAALFAACCGSYYRERYSGFMPMKVLLRRA